MFGFSLPKLIVLALVILGVWFAFRTVTRLADQRGRAAGAKPEPEVEAADTVKCSVCDTYLPSSSLKNCGKAGCPY